MNKIWPLTFIAISSGFYFASSVLKPLSVAIILYFLISPFIDQSSKRSSIKRWISSLAIVTILGSLFFITVYSMVTPTFTLFKTGAASIDKIEKRLIFVQKPLNKIAKAKKKVGDLSSENQKVLSVELKKSSLGEDLFVITRSFVSNMALIMVLLIFFLVYGDNLFESIGNQYSHVFKKIKKGRVLQEVKAAVAKYLIVVSIINLILGILVASALSLYGFENILLWCVIVGTLNFIPYIGCFAGCFAVLLIAISRFDSTFAIWAPCLTYLIINTIEGQIVTPLALGGTFKVNPLLILLSMLYWGFIWGIAGLFLAVPILMIIKVIVDHSTESEKFSAILSG